LDLEAFRKDHMTKVPLEEHLEEHDQIDKTYGVDCNSLSVDDHLFLHLKYRYEKGMISLEVFNFYTENK
jgi:hypothetical protein